MEWWEENPGTGKRDAKKRISLNWGLMFQILRNLGGKLGKEGSPQPFSQTPPPDLDYVRNGFLSSIAPSAWLDSRHSSSPTSIKELKKLPGQPFSHVSGQKIKIN